MIFALITSAGILHVRASAPIALLQTCLTTYVGPVRVQVELCVKVDETSHGFVLTLLGGQTKHLKFSEIALRFTSEDARTSRTSFYASANPNALGRVDPASPPELLPFSESENENEHD